MLRYDLRRRLAKRSTIAVAVVSVLAGTGAAAYAVVSTIQDPRSPGAVALCADDATGAVSVSPSTGCTDGQTRLVLGGPTDAYKNTIGGRFVGTDLDGAHNPILLLDVPSGRWAVTAKTRLENNTGAVALVRCRLRTVDFDNNVIEDNAYARLGAERTAGDHQTLPLQLVVAGQRQIALACENHNGPGLVYANDNSIQAVRVDSINGRPAPGSLPGPPPSA